MVPAPASSSSSWSAQSWGTRQTHKYCAGEPSLAHPIGTLRCSHPLAGPWMDLRTRKDLRGNRNCCLTRGRSTPPACWWWWRGSTWGPGPGPEGRKSGGGPGNISDGWEFSDNKGWCVKVSIDKLFCLSILVILTKTRDGNWDFIFLGEFLEANHHLTLPWFLSIWK